MRNVECLCFCLDFILSFAYWLLLHHFVFVFFCRSLDVDVLEDICLMIEKLAFVLQVLC